MIGNNSNATFKFKVCLFWDGGSIIVCYSSGPKYMMFDFSYDLRGVNKFIILWKYFSRKICTCLFNVFKHAF